ncbi:hypothetical protein LINPERPRIM_LOCUS28945 [Linum perenne]
MDSRKRPLHTCAISLLEIVTKLYASARKSNCRDDPLPWIIFALQFRLLAILAFVDDRILSLESFAENIFPPLKHLFDRIDAVVQEAEGLPSKLDGCIERIFDSIRTVPFLDRVLVYSVSCVEFLFYVLNQWGRSMGKEKVNVPRKPDGRKTERCDDLLKFTTKSDYPSSSVVSEMDETDTTDSDCSRIKPDRKNVELNKILKEPEDSESGIEGTSWGNVMKGRYEEEEEIMKTKGRRQGKKGSKGVHQDETREVKARRKGKRKKMTDK